MAQILISLLMSVTVHALGPDWSAAEKKLKAAKFSPEFCTALQEATSDADFKEIIELNTLLFLKRNDYHGVQVTEEASAAVNKFYLSNVDALKKAEEDFGVPGKVVTSLLWMESRHGQNQGRFSVATVFVDLLQIDQPKNLKHLYQASTKFTKNLTRSKRRGIASRAHKRVKWALAELHALEQIWQNDPTILERLHGSFAGAFGMPQFEPSSYFAYARSYGKEHQPDLTDAADAIQSVAFYLKQNGWKNTKRSQIHALLKYNNSKDYARAILKLAGISSRQNVRVPANSSTAD